MTNLKAPTPDAAMIERARAYFTGFDADEEDVQTLASWFAAERALARAEAFEEAEKIVIGRINRSNDCELLGSMDPETGAYECSMEIRSGDCLCAEHVEEAEEIRRLIRASKDAPPKPVTAPEETPNG